MEAECHIDLRHLNVGGRALITIDWKLGVGDDLQGKLSSLGTFGGVYSNLRSFMILGNLFLSTTTLNVRIV